MNIPSTNGVSGCSQPADSYQRTSKKADPVKFSAGDVHSSDPTIKAGDNGSHPSADSTSKRLRAYADKIATRLQNALASPDITPRQRTMIQEQGEKLRSQMNRLEGTYLSPSAPEGRSAMNNAHTVLNQITTSLNQVFAGTKATGLQISTSMPSDPTAQQGGGLDTVA